MAETMSGFGGCFCESHQEEPEEFRVATGREPVPPIDIADEVVSVGGGRPLQSVRRAGGWAQQRFRANFSWSCDDRSRSRADARISSFLKP